ncbi:hypothetical protein LY78DRAFT_584384 [Colletotrichum sublineola]|nr:hypothetical protein LY78DRAFT_584384 [Colletotrichum sublineola]
MVSLPSDSRQSLSHGFVWSFIVIVIIFMGVRIYIRGYRMRRAWKSDDTMFMLSSICTIAQCVMVLLMVTVYGLGVHIWRLPLTSIKGISTDCGLKYGAIVSLLYNLSFAIIKATYLLQYRRAFGLPSVTRLCDILLVILSLISVALLVANGVVMRELLLGVLIPSPETIRASQTLTYVTGATHLASDIVIFMMPMVLLCPLRVTRWQKIGLYASFGVGIITSAISIFKIVTAHIAFSSIDVSYQSTPVTLLSIAEPTSAIIFACVPLIRPLLQRNGASKDGSYDSSSHLTSSAGTRPDPMRFEHSMQPQSPASLSTPTSPQMSRIMKTEGSIDGDIEGYHAALFVEGRGSSMTPFTTHLSTPTKN